jgi:hypothetical protein
VGYPLSTNGKVVATFWMPTNETVLLLLSHRSLEQGQTQGLGHSYSSHPAVNAECSTFWMVNVDKAFECLPPKLSTAQPKQMLI